MRSAGLSTPQNPPVEPAVAHGHSALRNTSPLGVKHCMSCLKMGKYHVDSCGMAWEPQLAAKWNSSWVGLSGKANLAEKRPDFIKYTCSCCTMLHICINVSIHLL